MLHIARFCLGVLIRSYWVILIKWMVLFVRQMLNLKAKLMSTNKHVESRQQFISDTSRALKVLARELNVPVITLSQLNRAVDSRPDHKPVLADLRESGAIEQDADVVMFIYRDDYYNPDTEKKGIAEIIIAKQRKGATGSVDLVWMQDYTKFANKEHPQM